jgi:hypothetical protein
MPEKDDILNPNDFEDALNEEESGVSTEDNAEEEVNGASQNSTNEEESNANDETRKDSEDEKKKQLAEKNRKFAEERRKREAEEKKKRELEEVRKQAKLEAELGIIKKNTYTDKPIRDEEDLKIFKIQQELEEKGLDPIADLPERLAEINRQNAKLEKEKLEESNKETKRIQDGVKNLRKAYPNLNFSELSKDTEFTDFATPRLERGMDLVDIYEFYQAVKKNKADETKNKDLINKGAKDLTSTPSSQKSNSGKKQKTLEEMTDEEFKEFYKENYHS